MVEGGGTSNVMEMVDDYNHGNKDEINSNDCGVSDDDDEEEEEGGGAAVVG